MKPAAELTPAEPMSAYRIRLALDLCVLAGCCAFLFFFGLGSVGLAGADEPRYAQIAREMLARHDWVTPVLNGRPWLEKPVLYYWEAMLSYRIFGVSDWAARLPSAVDATALVAAVYWFVRRFSRGLELDAALITASTAFIIGFGHAGSTDMPLAATFSIAMLGWMAWRLGSPAPGVSGLAAGLNGRRDQLSVFYGFLGLATLAKGPIALFLAALIISTFCAIRREVSTIRKTLWWPGIVLYLGIAMPWYVLVQLHTGNFFRVFILEHNLERYSTTVYRHTAPVWFFIPIMLLALLPWTVPAVAGLVQAVKRVRPVRTPENDLGLMLALWGVLPVIFFSFSGSKLPGYILPALPPFALLAALWLRERSASSEQVPWVLIAVHALVASAMLGLVVLSPYLTLRLYPPRAAVAISASAGIAVFGIIVWLVRSSQLRMLRFVTLLPVILGLAFLLRVAAPVFDTEFSARPVAREISTLRPAKAPLAIFEVERELEYGLGFYLDCPIPRYERGEILHTPHLLVSRSGGGKILPVRLPGLQFTPVGSFSAGNLEFYWVTPK